MSLLDPVNTFTLLRRNLSTTALSLTTTMSKSLHVLAKADNSAWGWESPNGTRIFEVNPEKAF